MLLHLGVVSTFAGQADSGTTDATKTNAKFLYPGGVSINSDDTVLYVADTGNNRIRAIMIATG